MTAALVISEQNGLQRAIVLHERSLPFKGAVLVENEQRVEITFFPGNPVAYSQVLGPAFKGTIFTGKWQDQYVFFPENAPVVANFPQLTSAGKPQGSLPQVTTGAVFSSSGSFPGTQELRLSKTIVAAFELLVKSGAHFRVEWSNWARFGHMTRFKAWPGPEDEWEFEIEFAWTGDTDVQPKVTLPGLNLKSFLDVLADLISGLASLLALPGLLVKKALSSFLSDVADIMVQANRLVGILNGYADFTFLPLSQLASIKGLAYALRSAILDLFNGRDDGRLEGSGRKNVTDAWESELFLRKVRQILMLMAEELSLRLAEIEANSSGETQEVYTAASVTSLQRVSREVYGTPNNWREIAAFNNLSSQIIDARKVLKIPKLSG